MASLKDLVKKALDKKQGVKTDDGHDAVAHAQQTVGSNARSVKGGAKPTTRTTGRGR
jgi:hypothetical protein